LHRKSEANLGNRRPYIKRERGGGEGRGEEGENRKREERKTKSVES